MPHAGGAQYPRISLIPEFPETAGDDAIELAATAGLFLDPWQQFVLRSSLGMKGGRWSAFRVALVVARQNGKGSVLEARELAGMFAFGEKLIIHSAHEQATSSEHQLRMLELIESVPEFEQRVLKAPKGKGMEAIILKSGERILFKTRTGGGGRGFTGDLVVLDEAMILPETFMGALVPTMAARSVQGNPQIWLTGSAVDQLNPKHDGVVLSRVRKQALEGAPRLAYMEYGAEGDDPELLSEEDLADRERWAHGNPGLGIRISEEYISDERDTLQPRTFAVERLGVGDWVDVALDGQDGISREMWLGCQEAQSALMAKRSTAVFAVDVTPSRSAAAIGGAGWRTDDLAHIEVVAHGPGTDWVVARAKALQKEHGGDVVVDERGPAAALIQSLEDAGVRLRKVGGREMADGAGMIFDALAQRVVRHGGTGELTAAALGAAQRPIGDAWAWSRKTSTVDISPLVSVTLAYWGLRNNEAPGEFAFI